MSGKQMEGDNTQRRGRGREAREHGERPSEAHVTLGASKAPERVRDDADHERRLSERERGKQRARRRT
jgi:hypothetical protein